MKFYQVAIALLMLESLNAIGGVLAGAELEGWDAFMAIGSLGAIWFLFWGIVWTAAADIAQRVGGRP